MPRQPIFGIHLYSGPDWLLSHREKTHVSVWDNDGYCEHAFCLYRSRLCKTLGRFVSRGPRESVHIGVLLCHFATQNASMCPFACKASEEVSTKVVATYRGSQKQQTFIRHNTLKSH